MERLAEREFLVDSERVRGGTVPGTRGVPRAVRTRVGFGRGANGRVRSATLHGRAQRRRAADLRAVGVETDKLRGFRNGVCGSGWWSGGVMDRWGMGDGGVEEWWSNGGGIDYGRCA